MNPYTWGERVHRRELAPIEDTPGPASPVLVSPSGPCCERVEAGERLEAARVEDRRWREAQRERLQAGIDMVCRRELRARQVALAGAYVIANFLLMALIIVVTDGAAGNPLSLIRLAHLVPAMVLLPLLASAPWALFRLRRTHLQRQAQRLAVEVTLPERLRARPRAARGVGRPALAQAHAVERLLAQRRARANEPGATFPRSGG